MCSAQRTTEVGPRSEPRPGREWPAGRALGTGRQGASGDEVADPLGRAVLRIQGGGPRGQLPEFTA